jgi:hypothetical protein
VERSIELVENDKAKKQCLTFHDANRHYKTLDDHRLHRYRKTITVSDEAFLWQIMRCYPSNWKEELQFGPDDQSDEVTETAVSVSESTDSSSSQSVSVATDIGGKKKKGPTKGFKDTASKTIEYYKEYLPRVTRARQGENWKLWSKRLLEIALRREFGARTVKQMIPPVMTIAPMVQTVNHFIEFAPLGVVNTTEFTGDSDEE